MEARRLKAIAAGIVVSLLFGVLVWFITEEVSTNRTKIQALERIERVERRFLALILENQAIIKDATDPSGCIAQRNAYNTTVAVLNIVNDNRKIHNVEPLPMPKPPATIMACVTPAIRGSTPPPRAQRESPQTEPEPRRESAPRPRPTQSPSPSPSPTPTPTSPPRPALCEALPFLPFC